MILIILLLPKYNESVELNQVTLKSPIMQKRLDMKLAEPDAYKAMLSLEKYIWSTSLPPLLMELIKIRASNLNGCAYCIDMHTQEAIQKGEDTRRLFALAAWKESPLFREEERAALELTDEVTLIGKNGVKDETYNEMMKFFAEKEVAQIIMQIVIINCWNRIAVSINQVFEGG